MYVHILKLALGMSLLVNVVLAAVLLATGHSAARKPSRAHHVPVCDRDDGVRLGDDRLCADRRQGRARRRLPTSRPGHKALLRHVGPAHAAAGASTSVHGARLAASCSTWSAPCSLLAWWLAMPSNPFLLFGPGSAFLAPGPGLLATYVPVAILGALIVAARVVALWQPRLRPVVGLVCNACWASPPSASSGGSAVPTSSPARAPTRRPT